MLELVVLSLIQFTIFNLRKKEDLAEKSMLIMHGWGFIT